MDLIRIAQESFKDDNKLIEGIKNKIKSNNPITFNIEEEFLILHSLRRLSAERQKGKNTQKYFGNIRISSAKRSNIKKRCVCVGRIIGPGNTICPHCGHKF